MMMLHNTIYFVISHCDSLYNDVHNNRVGDVCDIIGCCQIIIMFDGMSLASLFIFVNTLRDSSSGKQSYLNIVFSSPPLAYEGHCMFTTLSIEHSVTQFVHMEHVYALRLYTYLYIYIYIYIYIY